MSYLINDVYVDPETGDGQAALARAYDTHTRVHCDCRKPEPAMYIAAIGPRFILKRMPGTGADHAPGCASFAPPPELSGLGQLQGKAIQEDPGEGTTLLKLDFALSMNGKRSAPPEPSGKIPTEAKASPSKLTLTALLHYFWQEAELTRWYPGMSGKRWWGVVQNRISSAASGKTAKSKGLRDILLIPPPWSAEAKASNAAARKTLFAALAPKGRKTPLGLLIAEYKSHEPTRLGAKFLFKHMPDCAFFADEGLVARFERLFEDRLRLADMVGKAHVIIIATFGVSHAGYPELQEVGLMLVTANWIPFEHLREAELISELTRQRRAFIKSLRFNLAPHAPMASAVVMDLPEPVALFVAGPGDSEEEAAALIGAARDGRYTPWFWTDEGVIPALPGNTPADTQRVFV